MEVIRAVHGRAFSPLVKSVELSLSALVLAKLERVSASPVR